jgi:MFS family permease
LYFSCLLGFFCSTANGFDGSLFNSLLEIDQFKAFFNVADQGIWAGIVTSMYQIGSVVAIPFIGPAIDTWGRKVGMAIGATLIVVGTSSKEPPSIMLVSANLWAVVSSSVSASPLWLQLDPCMLLKFPIRLSDLL